MAVSNDETSGFTIYWRIENFDPEPSFDYLHSKIFKIQSMNANWKIQINEENGHLGAYLLKMSNATKFVVHYSLSLLTGSGWTTVVENDKKRFIAGGAGYGEGMIYLTKLKREEWFYLPNGCLTISFHIWNDHIKGDSCQRLMISRLINGDYLRHRPIQTFSTLKQRDLLSFPISYDFLCNPMSNLDCQEAKEVKSQWTQTDPNYNLTKLGLSSNPVSTLNCQYIKKMNTQCTQTDTNCDFKDLDDLRKLFREKEFSFVTLRTPTQEFSVHKAVLCEKSPVFNAMLEGKMKESDCNVVDIDDIDNQTMDFLVKYFHFDPLDEMKFENALTLYYAADKYQIDVLKEQCVSLLKKELSIKNVCDVLILADFHQDSGLMNYALEYFCKNSKLILTSSQWTDILGHAELVTKLLRKLADVS